VTDVVEFFPVLTPELSAIKRRVVAQITWARRAAL